MKNFTIRSTDLLLKPMQKNSLKYDMESDSTVDTPDGIIRL